MTNDRSARTVLAAMLLVAAVFVAMNRVVTGAPLGDWWLVIVLAVAGLAAALVRTPSAKEEEVVTERPYIREYLPSTVLPASPETASIPQNTDAAMVMSPTSPETADEKVSAVRVYDAVDDVLPATEEIPPAPETITQPSIPEPVPASPQTPAATVTTEPVETVPVSPQTPAPQSSPEPLPASPETAAIETVMPDHAEPSVTASDPVNTQAMESTSVNPTANQVPIPSEPSNDTPGPSHMAKTEHAESERIAEREAPPAPPVKEGDDTPSNISPEEQVVMEATADAPQPYETDQHGQVTPEDAASVAEGTGSETQIADNLTETAIPAVQDQQTANADTPGKPDDLERIDGIGKKAAAALKAAGIDSFQKLANSSESQLQEILRGANMRGIFNSASWAQQASYAAQGDWENFNRINRERKGKGG